MPRPADPGTGADLALLSPITAGTAAEAATGDDAVLAAMVRTEQALLRVLVDTGLAPREAGAVADLLGTVAPDPRELALAAVTGGNPVIPLVRHLREAVAGTAPDLAGWVHHGTTSQDVLDTALALVARDTTVRLEADLLTVADRLAELADRHRGLPAVARTLTQQALPTTFGLRVAGWLAGVHDALDALAAAGPLPVSLGGPAGTAAAYAEHGPEVAAGLAAALGLAEPVLPWHTRRVPLTTLGHALTAATAACGKVAADVLVMAQREVGELREGTGGPSSAMAHKANPATSVLLAAAAREAPAQCAVLLASAAAEQERPAGAWHAEWQPLRRLLRLAGAAAERTTALVAGLEVDAEAMAGNLEQLRAAVGAGPDWVAEQVRHTGLWIDRVLDRHAVRTRPGDAPGGPSATERTR